jgi:hypothetical protein
MQILYITLGLLAIAAPLEARSLPRRRDSMGKWNRLIPKRQSTPPNQFNPAPNSGFDDPTVQIADPSFATAIKAGYQGPMASYEDHALVGPVDLMRNGMVNYGVVPNFTTPLYAGVSEGDENYWWIVTDSSDEGEPLGPRRCKEGIG